MTVCPECKVSFVVYREREIVKRSSCYQHRDGDATPAPDPLAISRLRRSWSSVETLRMQPIPRADLRDDQRAERQRERQENAEPWRASPEPDPEPSNR